MPEKAIPMTKKGLDNLGRESEELKSLRKNIAETIHTAQEHGTSQNDAEYDHAKQEQSMLEGRIRDLEETIRRSTLIDEKKVQLEVSEQARDWIADKGYDKTMGARPMQRLIQEKIKKPLAEEILFGQFSSKGGVVYVNQEEDGLSLKFKESIKDKDKVS